MGKVVVAENRVEDMDEEGSRSLGKILQCSIRDVVQARSFSDSDNHVGLVNFFSGG